MSINGPGTAEDLVADAHALGYGATTRLVTDWVGHGLLDRPTHKARGRGRGSEKGLYAENQRHLFVALLEKRESDTRHVRTLARVPVFIWCLFGDDYVPTRQALRAFKTWLGDAKVNRVRAEQSARQLVEVHDHPAAPATARSELVRVLAGVAYNGRVDDEARLERAVRSVFEPATEYGRLHRALGHPDVALTAEGLPRLIRSHAAAANALMAGRVSEADMKEARTSFLVSRAAYVTHVDEYRAQAPEQAESLFGPPTLQALVDTCASDLLTVLGEAILRSAREESMARAVQVRPAPPS